MDIVEKKIIREQLSKEHLRDESIDYVLNNVEEFDHANEILSGFQRTKQMYGPDMPVPSIELQTDLYKGLVSSDLVKQGEWLNFVEYLGFMTDLNKNMLNTHNEFTDAFETALKLDNPWQMKTYFENLKEPYIGKNNHSIELGNHKQKGNLRIALGLEPEPETKTLFESQVEEITDLISPTALFNDKYRDSPSRSNHFYEHQQEMVYKD
jgi:hypothetical protein